MCLLNVEFLLLNVEFLLLNAEFLLSHVEFLLLNVEIYDWLNIATNGLPYVDQYTIDAYRNSSV